LRRLPSVSTSNCNKVLARTRYATLMVSAQEHTAGTHTPEQDFPRVQEECQRTCIRTLELYPRWRRLCGKRPCIRSSQFRAWPGQTDRLRKSECLSSGPTPVQSSPLTTSDTEARRRRQRRQRSQCSSISLCSGRPRNRTQAKKGSGICRGVDSGSRESRRPHY
jgi:hypothetical protein